MIDLEKIDIPEEYKEAVTTRVKGLYSHPLIQEVLAEQKEGLSKDLLYHSYTHIEEVICEAVFLALVDCLSDTEVELIAIAAAFHDVGFLERRMSNEVIGAKLASDRMYARGEYTKKECDTVYQMILDTSLVETPVGPRQIPTTPLSAYLLDADIANFGRKDFFQCAEAYRREISQNESVFYQKTLELIQVHTFYTSAAKQYRSKRKMKNIARLQRKLVDMRHAGEQLSYYGVSLDRLGFLTQLPILINSSLVTKEIIARALEHLNNRIDCEASTVFLTVPRTRELEFWALDGGTAELSGQRLPKGTGVAGWVIEHQESALINDVSSDPRFFKNVDKEVGFSTESMICVPLLVRGDEAIGALQLLNAEGENGFLREDLLFSEHVARHLALSLENAQLVERMNKQNQELALLDRRRSEMSSIIAHEFRTPLNVIQSATELMALEHQNEEEKELVRLIKKGVSRLVQLIDEVRDLSVASEDNLQASFEFFSVEETVKSLSDRYTQVLKDRSLRLVVDIEPGVEVLGDKALILIVLKNLLANAIRFTEDKGAIFIKGKKKAGALELSVEDTGIGIPEDQLDAIFRKFYEVQSIYEHSSGTYEFKSGGLGLGLATVQSILGAHGTSAQVESELGKGSRFFFSLPLSD